MTLLLLALGLGFFTNVAVTHECRAGGEAVVDAVRAERVTGSLAAAEAEARRLLECPDLEAATRRGLRIELARVLDRQGLHHNTRPVAEVREILAAVERDLAADDARGRAEVALALAGYHYRAEMAERQFPTTTAYAQEAESLYRSLGNPVGEGDAVHRLGLVAMQKRELEAARELFDRSLELAERGPRRPIFLSDYHRHVGFVDMLEGDQARAISHFETSLALRDEAGSRDYGLFARTMLGSELVDGGRAAEAAPLLEEAVAFAREIPSPVGELRATWGFAKMHEALGDLPEARRSYARAEEAARRLGVEGIREAAAEALARLEARSSTGAEE
jgi:tetratricopeptide (TPR) repeat protein